MTRGSASTDRHGSGYTTPIQPRRAGTHSALGNYDLGIDAYRKAVLIDPSSARDYAGLGYCYGANRDAYKAESACNTAIQLDSKSIQAHTAKVWNYRNSKMYRAAIVACLDGLKHIPEEPTLTKELDELLQLVALENKRPALPNQTKPQVTRSETRRPATNATGRVFTSFNQLDGVAFIVAPDGQYLGLVSSDRFDDKSIMNSQGKHGSRFDDSSIFNRFGDYGGELGKHSPSCRTPTEPPRVFLGETFIGHLTLSHLYSPRIDPDALIGYLKSQTR